MAGWRVSIEEKVDGHTLVWYNDAPGGSSQILRTYDSWDEAVEALNAVRAEYVEEYSGLSELTDAPETPEKPDPEVETPEKSTKGARPKKA